MVRYYQIRQGHNQPYRKQNQAYTTNISSKSRKTVRTWHKNASNNRNQSSSKNKQRVEYIPPKEYKISDPIKGVCNRTASQVNKYNYKMRFSRDDYQKNLSVMTWNVCQQMDEDTQKRQQHIFDFCQSWKSTVLCLQQIQSIHDNGKGMLHSYLEQTDHVYYYNPNIAFNSTIILSRVPATFYEVKFPDDISKKPFSICLVKYRNVFGIKDERTKQILPEINVLIYSLHLKSTTINPGLERCTQIRLEQLRIIEQLNKDQSLNAHVIIAAGDFNIGDAFMQNETLKHNYIDFVTLHNLRHKNQPLQRLYTKRQTQDYQRERFDRILIKFKDHSQIQQISNLQRRIRTQERGMAILGRLREDKLWPSDHAGVFAKFF